MCVLPGLCSIHFVACGTVVACDVGWGALGWHSAIGSNSCTLLDVFPLHMCVTRVVPQHCVCLYVLCLARCTPAPLFDASCTAQQQFLPRHSMFVLCLGTASRNIPQCCQPSFHCSAYRVSICFLTPHFLFAAPQVAPEVVHEYKMSKPSDIFSLGVGAR